LGRSPSLSEYEDHSRSQTKRKSVSILGTLRRRPSVMFVLDRFPLNLFVSWVGEVVLSLVGGGFVYPYAEQKILVEREFGYLLRHYHLNRIKRIIVIGAGAIPYSAIFLYQRIGKPTYAVERNPVSYLACVRLLRRLRLSTIIVVKRLNQIEQYIGEYENSLVLITLQTRLKQEVMRRVLSQGPNTVVMIRVPSGANIGLFESVTLGNDNFASLEHDKEGVKSIFISDRKMQKALRLG